jgi:hypothetical protein
MAVLVGVVQRLGARPAVPDGDDPADHAGHGGIVGDYEDGDAERGVGRLQRREDGRGGRAVQLSGGLVGEQRLRPVRDRHRDRGTLLLAAGHLVRPPGGTVRDAENVEELKRVGAPVPAAHAGQLHRHLHVLGRGQVRQQVA